MNRLLVTIDRSLVSRLIASIAVQDVFGTIRAATNRFLALGLGLLICISSTDCLAQQTASLGAISPRA
jgi:hypothetical protein